MANFNKVILVGRLTADPELKTTGSGISVTSFSIAVNRRFSKSEQTQQVDFINIVAWRQNAEFICRHFKKGRPILICGQLQTRNWTDQNGAKRVSTEVVVDEVTFVDSKSDGTPGAGGAQYTPDAYGAPSFSNDGASGSFEEVPSGEDLPF